MWLDQLRLAAEINPDRSIRSQFIYADGINSPEYMIKDGVRYFFVKDHRGSVLKVVDIGTGEVKQELKYSEFGEVLQDTNPGFQPFGFAGGLYDPDTKLVGFGARDYDGRIGRWLSKDPIRFDGGTTNLYEYSVNDPINYLDSEGTFSWGPIWSGFSWFCRLADCPKGGGPFLNKGEEEELKQWRKEEEEKREWEKEGCGVVRSCEPEKKPLC